MARRARQHPMDFGHASTFAELVDIPEIRNIAERFLGLIDYYGLAEVEFMQDPRDGNYKLIEVNPRVWGWHTIAIASGVPAESFRSPKPEVKEKRERVSKKSNRPTISIFGGE